MKRLSITLCLIVCTMTMSSCGEKYRSLAPSEFKMAVESDTLQLVDVRTAEEFAEMRLPGSINVDVKSEDFLSQALSKLDKNRGVAVYCRSGVRSANAAEQLIASGFKVTNLDGGILGWVQQGLEVVDKYDFRVAVGETAPDFAIEIYDREGTYSSDYSGGKAEAKKLSLSDFRGKIVMLQFTASWCSVCRDEMPHIENEIWLVHKDNPDFVLIAVDRDEPAPKIAASIKATGITYDIGFDPAGEIYAKYALPGSGITRNVLIDRDGKILMLTRLYDQTQFNALKDKIASLLKR